MKSILSATHLLRQFVLFALTILLLLTVIRTAYGLWLFPKIAEANAFLPLFIQGLRFDLALIGQISIVPVVVGSLLSVTKLTRGLAKIVIVLFLTIGLFLVLILELLTPWFISIQGVRPDLNVLGSVENPLSTIQSVFVQRPCLQLAVYVVVFLAYASRGATAVHRPLCKLLSGRDGLVLPGWLLRILYIVTVTVCCHCGWVFQFYGFGKSGPAVY